MIRIFKTNLTSLQILAIGFAATILLGAGLLSLPAASRDGRGLLFMSALFTSASATCVTGLTLFDTYTRFSFFGQAVILCLVQIGGLGFMTVALFFSMAINKKIGLRERSVMMESIGALKIGGIIRLARRVVYGTIIIELVGAVLLSLRFCPEFGFITGIWYGLFHSISAFCNAGFDLMGRVAPSSSLITFADDALVNIVIASLVTIGGIGFVVWDDIIDNKWRFRSYRLHSKIVITTSAALILAGAVGFYAFEANHAFAGMTTSQKVLASVFQSITPRTAGFYTFDISELSESGSILTLTLMLIGASPGSTGGGIKTTTFFVIIFSVLAYTRNRDAINVFHRKIDEKAVERAYNSTALYIVIAIAGVIVISTQGLGLNNALHESVSAITTVGMSRGITSELSTVSKVTVMILMYIGRLGSLSVTMAVSERRVKTKINSVKEKIITG